ncbi:MAG: tRNA modification GTPase [Desulfonauticus sp.]|jgi:tRNA modification GTPase|nr:tRNA modification GTPase [Desulfonauticus sp.]
MEHQKDTISAIVTPLGQGGVGIIRLSGKESLNIALRLFKSSQKHFTSPKPYRLHHGHVYSTQGELLDEVLLAYMPEPGSYTGEDVVEINCHGGPAILQALLEETLKLGARLAKPGEFTYRAFLNGKLDLTQAEAVAELISAPTKKAIPLAQQKLSGLLKEKISSLRANLEEIKQHFCLAVDFPEEELEILPPTQLSPQIKTILREIQELITNYEQKHIYQDGALVVLTGRVNAGKSSLLNALIGKERALVTPIPGTTRDYLEESINLKGLPVRLVDTAGLRETQDEVENLGLKRGWELLKQCDLCLLLIDIEEEWSEFEDKVLESIEQEKIILVINKIDKTETKPLWLNQCKLEPIFLSAKTGKNLNLLTEQILKKLVGQQKEQQSLLVPNLRQKICLQQAQEELEKLLQNLSQFPYDLLSLHLDVAIRKLAEITGEITTEETLEAIFSRFCIGK